MDVFEDPGVAEVYDDYGDDYEDDGYLEDYHQGDEANACEDDFQQGGGFANDFEDGEGGYPDDDDVDYIDGEKPFFVFSFLCFFVVLVVGSCVCLPCVWVFCRRQGLWLHDVAFSLTSCVATCAVGIRLSDRRLFRRRL